MFPEYDIAQIEVGQKVEMTSDGIEGKVYTGTVTKLNLQHLHNLL